MKRNSFISKFLIVSIFLNIAMPSFAEDTTPKPYDKEELPQTIKDIRRFEIITLGALPFVTIDTTLAYSTWRYMQHDFDANYKPDPFSASSFSQEEQRNLILTSVGICIGIGLTDLIVQIIKRNYRKRKAQVNYDDISIVPISEDEEAQIIPLPPDYSEEYPGDEVQEIEE